MYVFVFTAIRDYDALRKTYDENCVYIEKVNGICQIYAYNILRILCNTFISNVFS